MTTATAEYQQFRALRQSLATLLERSQPLFQKLDMATWVDTITKLAARVSTDRFRVMVLGEFKRGKSTFINALLGEEVLPACAPPCTAVINEVKWGAEKRAVIHFRDPVPNPLPATIPDGARQHLARSPGKPLEVAVHELEKYVVIPDPGKDQAESVAETPYERVEIFWPLALCDNGVEIIDSPGLNEHQTRTRTTKDYLAQIDAVIFVLSVHALASESELTVIDHDVRASGHEYLFFVCNRFDELRKQMDRDRIVQYAHAKLADRTAMGREGIFFISALDALEGRVEGNTAMVERSRMPPLEQALARFLVRDRGRIKMLQPAGRLARGTKTALVEVIPGRYRMLEDDVNKLRQRYEQAKPQLDQAAKRRDQVLRSIDAYRGRLRDTVRREAQSFFRDMCSSLPVWAKQLQLQRSINPLKVWALNEQAKAVVQETIQALTPRIEAAMAEWQEDRLKPLMQEGLTELAEGVNASLGDLLERLDHLKADLTGMTVQPEIAGSQMSPVERVLASAGGLILGGPGMALTGATMGYDGIVRSLLPQIGVIVGAMLLGLTNPIALAAMLLGAGFVQTMLRGGAITEKAKLQVADGLAAKLLAEAPQRAEAIADQVYEETSMFTTAAAAGVDKEIAAVREQVEGVLRIREEGEAKAQQQRQELGELEKQFRALDTEVTALVDSLVR